jgi:hypothetical protein
MMARTLPFRPPASTPNSRPRPPPAPPPSHPSHPSHSSHSPTRKHPSRESPIAIPPRKCYIHHNEEQKWRHRA